MLNIKKLNFIICTLLIFSLVIEQTAMANSPVTHTAVYVSAARARAATNNNQQGNGSEFSSDKGKELLLNMTEEEMNVRAQKMIDKLSQLDVESRSILIKEHKEKLAHLNFAIVEVKEKLKDLQLVSQEKGYSEADRDIFIGALMTFVSAFLGSFTTLASTNFKYRWSRILGKSLLVLSGTAAAVFFYKMSASDMYSQILKTQKDIGLAEKEMHLQKILVDRVEAHFSGEMNK